MHVQYPNILVRTVDFSKRLLNLFVAALPRPLGDDCTGIRCTAVRANMIRRKLVPAIIFAALYEAQGFWAGPFTAWIRPMGFPIDARPPLHAVNIKQAVDFVSAVVGVATGITPAVQAGRKAFGSEQKERARNLKVAVERLDQSTVGLNIALQGGQLVMRDCFAVFNRTAQSARNDSQNYALLVYGPRGVGKTSIVAAALHGTAAVVSFSYCGDGRDLEDCLEGTLLKLSGLPVLVHGVDKGDRLRAILTFYNQYFKQRPIIVIDVNSKMEPAALSDLLLAIKQLGFEEKLATFIVVVSAPRSALGLTIDIKALRVKGYHAPDFSPEEAQEYVRRNLKAFPDLAQTVVEEVGTRAMHLVEACMECQGATSREECEKRIGKYRAARIGDARRTLRGFLGIAKKNSLLFSKGASVAFFTDLLDGKVELIDTDAEERFGFETPKALLEALAEYHAFAVDPFDGTVSMQSYFMRLAIEKYVLS